MTAGLVALTTPLLIEAHTLLMSAWPPPALKTTAPATPSTAAQYGLSKEHSKHA